VALAVQAAACFAGVATSVQQLADRSTIALPRAAGPDQATATLAD
jgi:hypothetical protein